MDSIRDKTLYCGHFLNRSFFSLTSDAIDLNICFQGNIGRPGPAGPIGPPGEGIQGPKVKVATVLHKSYLSVTYQALLFYRCTILSMASKTEAMFSIGAYMLHNRTVWQTCCRTKHNNNLWSAESTLLSFNKTKKFISGWARVSRSDWA